MVTLLRFETDKHSIHVINLKYMNFFEMFKKFAKGFVFSAVFAVTIVILVAFGNAFYDGFISEDSEENVTSSEEYSSCNVLGINLHGYLTTYVPTLGSEDDSVEYQAQYGDAVGSEDIVGAIWEANNDDSIKAIMLEIDSTGGSPVAGAEVAKALNESTKPTVAVIRQSGLSAAYWAATGAQWIFASKNSDIGSIGVTSSYLQELNPDANYIQLSSGKYKDAGDPDKPITEEEKKLFMRDVNIIYENFINDVATNRHISTDEVRAIADGSSVLGDSAKSLKLIDQIGGWQEAENYLESLIGETPSVCWQ